MGLISKDNRPLVQVRCLSKTTTNCGARWQHPQQDRVLPDNTPQTA